MSKFYISATNWLRQYLVNDERGVTAIEYGLIAGLVAVGLVLVLTQAGGAIEQIFGAVRDALQQAASSIP